MHNRFATRTVAAACVVAAAASVTACSSRPTRTDVTDRLAAELESVTDVPARYWTDIAYGVAGDAFDGRCGDDVYLDSLSTSSPDMAYAFGVTCLTYFEGDMSDDQRAEVRHATLDRIPQ